MRRRTASTSGIFVHFLFLTADLSLTISLPSALARDAPEASVEESGCGSDPAASHPAGIRDPERETRQAGLIGPGRPHPLLSLARTKGAILTWGCADAP